MSNSMHAGELAAAVDLLPDGVRHGLQYRYNIVTPEERAAQAGCQDE